MCFCVCVCLCVCVCVCVGGLGNRRCGLDRPVWRPEPTSRGRQVHVHAFRGTDLENKVEMGGGKVTSIENEAQWKELVLDSAKPVRERCRTRERKCWRAGKCGQREPRIWCTHAEDVLEARTCSKMRSKVEDAWHKGARIDKLTMARGGHRCRRWLWISRPRGADRAE